MRTSGVEELQFHTFSISGLDEVSSQFHVPVVLTPLAIRLDRHQSQSGRCADEITACPCL
jgi:hypothetical protein